MKKLILIMTVLIVSSGNIIAKDYIFESNNSNTVLSSIKYPNGKEYIHIENSGLWKDSNGDFGAEKCVGVIKKDKEQSQVEVRCEHTNQNDEKF